MKKYILGLLTVLCFIPIIESLTELFCSWIEALKINTAKKILIGNNELADLQAKLEPQATSCIGFAHPNSDDEDDEWEDDKVQNKIGF